jgi:hypothetical protein
MRVWETPTITYRDRKELLRTLIEEVNIKLEQGRPDAHLILRWRGGAVSELDTHLNRRNTPPIRTDEETIELVRRLAASGFYPGRAFTC